MLKQKTKFKDMIASSEAISSAYPSPERDNKDIYIKDEKRPGTKSNSLNEHLGEQE